MNFRAFSAALAFAASMPIAAHAAVSISVNIAPPPLPVYAQPLIPGPGYLWTPGYWRWTAVEADYFWVPGTWVLPPTVGVLWTPGYWGWAGGGGYAWHGGYWGPHVGFYGGINYGFGYVGTGYQGGYWRGGDFNYNRTVNNVNTTIIHNTYNTTVVENHQRVSFNGGQGGVAARPRPEEREARSESHIAPTPSQLQHERFAMRSPDQRISTSHGEPRMAAMAQPADGHYGQPRRERADGGPRLERGEAQGAQNARPIGGMQADRGDRGARSEHAVHGPQGEHGPNGPQGERGPNGPQGERRGHGERER